MDQESIIEKLYYNIATFEQLFNDTSEEELTWKPSPEKWCLLEVVCHLYDEEREDFGARVKQVLESPEKPFPSIDPAAWVTERKYMERNFDEMLKKFLSERLKSVKWLGDLNNPSWKNAYIHPKFGPISAEMLLANWLAHDYLHFRQITSLKYHYLKAHFDVDLGYAGTW